MAVDNNGSILSLPAVTSATASLSGTLFFGIGTQTNNGLGSATVLTTTLSSSAEGIGLITAIYNGRSLPDSFIDSGSTSYLFVDGAIPACTASGFAGYYCPASPLTLQPTLQGQNGLALTAALTLNNAQNLYAGQGAVLPGLGGDPQALDLTNDSPTSFDFGLPFFYGRNVYTAIEGRQAGAAVGPYYAF